jgi:hypothetical protein
MPRTAKVEDGDKGEGQVLPDLSNEFNDVMLKGFVADMEGEQALIEKIMENARVACQPHVDRMKEIAKEAAECGIEKKAFKAKLRERALERKAATCRATLSERQQEVFDRMTGMLPDDLFAYVDAKEAAAPH